MELLYREAEYFTVLRALLGNDLSLAEQEKLTAGWKHILTNQFHDIIPGSSIFEVYEDSKKDYEWIAAQGRGGGSRLPCRRRNRRSLCLYRF